MSDLPERSELLSEDIEMENTARADKEYIEDKGTLSYRSKDGRLGARGRVYKGHSQRWHNCTGQREKDTSVEATVIEDRAIETNSIEVMRWSNGGRGQAVESTVMYSRRGYGGCRYAKT
jgi:hypothetical protein